MNFNTRDIKEDDLPEIIRWFSKRKWPMPAVPGVGAKIGALAEKNGVMYACIYTYVTGTSVAYLEWPCTNPDVPLDQSMGAFDELIIHFQKMCSFSEPKIRVLCITTQSEHLSKRFEKHGFKKESGYHRALWTLKD